MLWLWRMAMIQRLMSTVSRLLFGSAGLTAIIDVEALSNNRLRFWQQVQETLGCPHGKSSSHCASARQSCYSVLALTTGMKSDQGLATRWGALSLLRGWRLSKEGIRMDMRSRPQIYSRLVSIDGQC